MSGLILHTRRGKLEVQLFDDDAPRTVAHIVSLARAGFYDGLVFHRIVPDFVSQAGCPNGDGTGGAAENIDDEPNEHRLLTGTLAMANRGPNTGSSQFFFCWRPIPELDGKHTVFGRITKGIDVLLRLRKGDSISRIEVV